MPLARAGDARATQRQGRSPASLPRRGCGKGRGVDSTPTATPIGKAWPVVQEGGLLRSVCVTQSPKVRIFSLEQEAEIAGYVLASCTFVAAMHVEAIANSGRSVKRNSRHCH
jgi:hypothetical protein